MDTEKDSGIVKDIFWYSVGVVVPMLLGFIKTPVFTRYFAPEEYGYLSIVSSTFGYIHIFTFSWLSSCLWRYYNHYKLKGMLGLLYSNILFLYLLSSALVIAVSLAWILISGSKTTGVLVLLFCAQVIVSQLVYLHMVVIRLERKPLKYNIITVCTSVSSFAVMLFMTFVLGLRIEAAVESILAINILVLAYILITTSYKPYISRSCISRDVISEFIKYGATTVISSLSLIVLSSGDRYLIALFKGMEAVGIYNQVYGIGEMSIVAFVGVYMNSISPILFKHLETNLENYGGILFKYTNFYILYLLPAAVYFSLFSKQIAFILLGEAFREGYRMMPFVMLTAFIYGMTGFLQDVLKFGNRLKVLVRGFVMAALLNTALNLMLLPFFSYHIAAATTLAAHLVLYVYYYRKDSTRYFHNRENLKAILPFVAVLMVQVLADQLLRRVACLEINVPFTVAEGLLFSAFYYALLERKRLMELIGKLRWLK